jgi:hypothetical protein
MNDRKRAWQILHTEIARRERGVPSGEPWSVQMGILAREADSIVTLIIELAGFGATLAQMSAYKSGRDPLEQADAIGMGVMQEPDDDEDEGAA